MNTQPSSAQPVMYGPFAETAPSGQTGWIDDRRRPILEHFRMMLGKLNNNDKITYRIWRGTDRTSIIVTSQDVGESFMQAVGSADALKIYVRLVDDEGNSHLYTVGNEPFDADQAARIFQRFYESEDVADSYTLQEEA